MNMSALRFGFRLLLDKLTNNYSPFLVQFSITNRCNLKCNYCYASYYKRLPEDMPIEAVKSIIDDLAKAGTFRINLVGGEPLLRNDLAEIIGYIRSKDIECAMTTNGFLVSSRIESLFSNLMGKGRLGVKRRETYACNRHII